MIIKEAVAAVAAAGVTIVPHKAHATKTNNKNSVQSSVRCFFCLQSRPNFLGLPEERKMAINGNRDINISAAYLKENRKIKKCRGYRQPENLPIKGGKQSFVCFRQRNTKFAA